MVNDSEKLTTILPYIRAMDEDIKRRLERFRQTNGQEATLAGFGYSELLDKIYEVHAKYQKERQEQSAPWLEKLRAVEEKVQTQCAQEINEFVEKTLGVIRKNQD